MDADGSGSVERDEIFAFFRGRLDPDMIESLFAKLDEDGSGTISREEWIKGYFDAGFGQGTIVGQSAEGLGVLLGLVEHHHTIDFADLHMHRPPMRIAAAEERGVTLAQLRRVMAHVEMRCGREAWLGVDGRRLTADTVTLYDVTRYVIKPATQQAQCSFIERIAEQAQPPVWFVSNWWGESFRRLLDCLEQHSRDRGVPDHCPYWISAFGHNQWLTDAPACWDSFQRALAHCVGTISVLDAHGVALRRAWCLYEIFLSLRKPDHKWDLYTALSHVCVTTKRVDGTRHRHCTAVGLLPDCAAADFHNCQVNKAARESFFPLQLALKGLRVHLSASQASVEADKRAVLSAVAGAPLGAAPPAEHEAFERLSRVIAGRVALAALRCAAQLGAGPAYQACLAALTQSGCEHSHISLSGCRAADASMMKALATALPRTLTRFTLLFRDVDEEGGRAFVDALVTRLTNGDFAHLAHLTLESNTIDADGARLLSGALASSGLPRLESISFGLPCPFGHEAASTLALIAYPQQGPQISFCGERLPTLTNMALPKLGLTSSDLILLVASMASGACGMVSSLDVSDNKIDNNGLRALELALKPGTKAYRSTINLHTIDLSNNPYTTKAAKQAVLEARRATDDGSRGRADPHKAHVVRTVVAYKLAPGFDFRIEPLGRE